MVVIGENLDDGWRENHKVSESYELWRQGMRLM